MATETYKFHVFVVLMSEDAANTLISELINRNYRVGPFDDDECSIYTHPDKLMVNVAIHAEKPKRLLPLQPNIGPRTTMMEEIASILNEKCIHHFGICVGDNQWVTSIGNVNKSEVRDREALPKL